MTEAYVYFCYKWGFGFTFDSPRRRAGFSRSALQVRISLIRRAYGSYPGFVIGWVDLLSFVADIALKAVVIVEFIAMLFPGTEAWRMSLAIIVTTAFAAFQLRGIVLSGHIQEFATAMIGLVVVGVALSPAVGSAVVVVAILMMLSHQNLVYMSAPRILHALAVDGFAAKQARKVGKDGNPIFAVLVTWVISVFLIMLGGFEFLLLLSIFFFVPLYLSLIVGVLILRKREPDSERPYRAWGHPYSTFVCLVGWTLITLFQAFAERETAIYALAMVAVSWPMYRYLIRNVD